MTSDRFTKPIDRELTIEQVKVIAEKFANDCQKASFADLLLSIDAGEMSGSLEEMRAKMLRHLLGH